LAGLTGAIDEVLDTAPLAPLDPVLHDAGLGVNLHGGGPQSHPRLRAARPQRLIAFGIDAEWRPGEHEVERWCRLLRAAGIPARYATGFAVVEYSAIEGAYIVRTRHSHAWSRAFVDGRWVEVDTTPADWAAEEEREAPIWQGLMDLMRFLGFQWSQRGEFKAGDGWYLVLVVLAGILAWRVLRGRKIVRDEKLAAATRLRFPGQDSEFYAVEKCLGPRDSTETQAAWFFRIEKTLPADRRDGLLAALRLHQRYRFDPDGITLEERKRLRELCAALAPQKA